MRPSASVAWLAALLLLAGCTGGEGSATTDRPAAAPGAPIVKAAVVRSWPHDIEAYTQGLDFHEGKLYEGTGLTGQSSLRELSLETAKPVRMVPLPKDVFGEGITVLGDRIYQVTWTSKKGYVFDRATFRKLAEFSYSGEGWGLDTDGKSLILSDGTSKIRFLDPKTFAQQRQITVNDSGREITQLNELEWIRGDLYANVWMTDSIARIDPQTGTVKQWLHLPGLLTQSDKRRYFGSDQGRINGAVLNGIAYDEATGRLVVTGKNWPKLFEIRIDSGPRVTTDR
jgi:glutamine cyclotransferase